MFLSANRCPLRRNMRSRRSTARGCARRDPPIQCDKLRDRARSVADVRECGLLAAPTVDHAHRSRTINRVRQGIMRMADLDKDGTIFVGKSGSKPEVLTLALANRHGLVTGATGTGKTVTLQVLAEGLSRAGVSVFAADIKGDLSGISEMGEAKEAFVSRAKSLGLRLRAGPVSGRVLGSVRRARPSRARHHLRGGTAAAVAAHGPQRRAGGRPQYLLPRGRRAGASDPRPQGSARHAWLSRGTCRRTHRPIRQCLQADHRHDPATAPGAGKSGRHQILQRAGAGAQGLHPHRPRRPRLHQHPGRRQADGEPAALRDLSALAVVGAVRGAARGRRSAQAQARVSSSTRRISSSPTRPRRCSTRSSRSCA